MIRKKADGPSFEKEFKKELEKFYYVRRLHTAFTSNPADFIVIGKTFNYVEVKETAGKSFSIASMQQLPEMKEFVAYRKKHKDSLLGKSKYYIVVHFIDAKLDYEEIKVIEASAALELLDKRETLKETTPCSTYSNLKELANGGLF